MTAWRAVTSIPGRLLLSVGCILGFGAVGTLAYWSDHATLSTGSIVSGSLDLQLGGRNPQTPDIGWEEAGQDGSLEYAVVELDNVSPGESVAMELHIRNAGSTALTFTGTGASDTNALYPHFTATTTLGGAASNTGTRESVDRAGSCSSGTIWWDKHALSVTEAPVRPGDEPFRLDPGERVQVCILAAFSSSAPGTYQGRSAGITVVLRAKQVSAP